MDFANPTLVALGDSSLVARNRRVLSALRGVASRADAGLWITHGGQFPVPLGLNRLGQCPESEVLNIFPRMR